jgi:hypothetical protein
MLLRCLAWGTAEVTRLVGCCPNLRSVDDVFLQPGVHVSEPRKLTALRYLFVTYELDQRCVCHGTAGFHAAAPLEVGAN